MIKSPQRPSTVAPSRKTLSPPLALAILGVAVLLITFIGWHMVNRGAAISRPDLPVHPGMYNLREELQKGMAAHPHSQ